MESEALANHIQQLLGDKVAEVRTQGASDVRLKVVASDLLEVARKLKEDPEVQCDFLMAVTGVDLSGVHEDGGFRVLYHLFSYSHRHTVIVEVDLERENPTVPSLAGLFASAEWNEREVYDLLGVHFQGHPDLRRILLPEEWEGHPLRKDYEEKETALGFPTTREDLMTLLRRRAGK